MSAHPPPRIFLQPMYGLQVLNSYKFLTLRAVMHIYLLYGIHIGKIRDLR